MADEAPTPAHTRGALLLTLASLVSLGAAVMVMIVAKRHPFTGDTVLAIALVVNGWALARTAARRRAAARRAIAPSIDSPQR